MYMIIGGSFQGKLDYALSHTRLKREDILDGACCGRDDIFRAEGIRNFHLYVRRFLLGLDEKELADFGQRLALENPDLVLITDEIGCGIVPLEKEERIYREAVGRVCTDLAVRADRVDRVICGFGMVLKGGPAKETV